MKIKKGKHELEASERLFNLFYKQRGYTEKKSPKKGGNKDAKKD